MTTAELEELKRLIEQQNEEDDDGLTVEDDPHHEKPVYKNLGYGGFRKLRLPTSDEQGY